MSTEGLPATCRLRFDQGTLVLEPVEAVVACPAGWPVVDLNAHAAEGGWLYEGDTTRDAVVSRGSCGGGIAANVLRFRADAAGPHVFEVAAAEEGPPAPCEVDDDCAFGDACAGAACGEPARVDTVLFVRSHCGLSAPAAHLDCDDDGGDGLLSLSEVDLEAGQEVFVFVDGYRRPRAPWRGRYTLRATGP